VEHDAAVDEREDLAELLRQRALTEDAARAEAVDARHGSGGRTARENVADLVDPGSFVEYGRLAVAAQRQRRELDELIARTPADGLVAGTARVGGRACAVLSYDYTVLAGTQGAVGHAKKDRLFELIERMRLPTVFFAEGGGGRPGDTDVPVVSALHVRAFALWARLSGLVPRIAIVRAAASPATPCSPGAPT
jgi:acetyl-CoA carboxylase carboxyltransferase component